MDTRSLLNKMSSLYPDAFLVGGAVRDLVLGRPFTDMDIAVFGDAGGAAALVGGRLGGTAFVMDAERGIHRVLLEGAKTVDIAAMGRGILADLSGRDFTVDAMAVPLSAFSGRGAPLDALIDPYGGRMDIGRKVIRALGEKNMTDDPLRMVRAFRLAGQLGFGIDGPTLAVIKRHAGLVAGASAERVRDELYIMLSGDGAGGRFREMLEAGVLRHILPEAAAMEGVPQCEPHAHDLLEHSIRAMEHAEAVMGRLGGYFGGRAGEVSDYLSRPVEGSLTTAGLVKLCAFLHDVGKPVSYTVEEGRIRFTGHDEAGAEISACVAARLRLSGRAAELLTKTARHHMRPLHMSKQGMTRRAAYRYVRDVGGDLPASLVVALADALATRDRPGAVETDVEAVAGELSEYYYGEYLRAKEEPLLRGRDLIEVFGLAPGPVFREILEDVEEKRAEGAIKDREGAVNYVRTRIGERNN